MKRFVTYYLAYLMVISSIIIIPMGMDTVSAEEESWLEGWDYRQEINITGSYQEVTDYQVRINLNRNQTFDFYLDGMTNGVSYAHQGITVNESYIWSSNNSYLSMQYKNNQTYITGTYTADDNSTYVHNGDICYAEYEGIGYIYSVPNNWPNPPDGGVITVYYASNLTYAGTGDLVFDFFPSAIAYDDGYFWVITGTDDDAQWVWKVEQNSLLDFDFVSNYTLSYALSSEGDYGYQGLDWYENYLILPVHSGNTYEMIDIYEFNGTGFEEVQRIPHIQFLNSESSISVTNEGFCIFEEDGIPTVYFATQSGVGGEPNDYLRIPLDVGILLTNETQNDYDDVRFTTNDGETEIDYWLEKYDDDHATFWVEVPSIPTSGISIYVYYGNDSVSTNSSIQDTFIFGDDFEDTDFSEWTGYEASTTLTRVDISGEYYAKMDRGTTSPANGWQINDTYPGENYVIEVEHYDSYTGGSSCGGVAFGFNDTNNSALNFGLEGNTVLDKSGIHRLWGASGFAIKAYNEDGAISKPASLILSARVLNDTITGTVLDDDGYSSYNLQIEATEDEWELNDSVGLRIWRNYVYFDDFRVRKIIDPIPIAYLIGEHNTAPSISTPDPANESTGVSVSQSTWSCLINDTDGDTFNWTIEVSNDDSNSANDATNGTKSVTLTTPLDYSTAYTIWVNVTDGTDWTNETFTFTTEENTAPSVMSPNPANESTGVSVSLSSWSCVISDSEGHSFNWSIVVTNGDSNSGTGASNGTKSVTLVTPLDYSTEYTVWVNVTDGYDSTNVSYIFTTDSNPTPTISSPSPANESTGVSVSLSSWSCSISDPNGDLMNWSIVVTNGDSDSGNEESNGSISVTLISLDYSTEYTVWVNVTDGTSSVNESFIFTTGSNSAPSISSPDPANNTEDVSISLASWSCTIEDLDGDLMNWSIEVSNSDSDSANGASNGSISVTLSSLEYSTEYTVYVNVTDGTDWTNETFTFTTEGNTAPLISSPDPANESTVSPLLEEWSCSISDSEGHLMNWSIEVSNGDSDSGNGASNGSISVTLSTLDISTEYTMWVNVTDGYDSTNESFIFTTSEGWVASFTSSPVTTGANGTPYSYNVVTNMSCSFSLDSNATFLSINSTTGMISGTPDSIDVFWVNVTATNGWALSSNQNYTLTIANSSDDETDPGPIYGNRITVRWSTESSGHLKMTFQYWIEEDDVEVIRVQWNFGDGHGSSLETLSHRYSSPGEYRVTCAVWGDNGGLDTEIKWISVGSENTDGPNSSSEWDLVQWIEENVLLFLIVVGLGAIIARTVIDKNRGGRRK